MENNTQGIRSEMEKTGEPKSGSLNRRSYYTNIRFSFEKKKIQLKAKVDTGATHTILGLRNNALKPFANKIILNNNQSSALTASDEEIKLYGYIVTDFWITQDILIPKIKLYFSEDIGEKAVLGMDILSLFDFQYLRERGSSNGTFWINNYVSTLDALKKRMLNKDIDYLDPELILDIDDILL
jgi:hypothetical protein